LTGKTCTAHDALEDSTALQVIMENESLKMCLSATLDNALHIKGSTSLYEGNNGDVTEIFSTFKGNMDTMLSSSMIEKWQRRV